MLYFGHWPATCVQNLEELRGNLTNFIRSPNTHSKPGLPERAAEAIIATTVRKISGGISSSSRTETHIRNGPTQKTQSHLRKTVRLKQANRCGKIFRILANLYHV
jgi:hypothetical protein